MSAITFNSPWALLGFAIFIPLLLWDFSSSHRKQIQKNLSQHLRLRLSVSRILFRIFLACMIIALSGPSWGTAPESVSGETLRAADVVIALDVSRSMEIRDGYAGSFDGKPDGISRLEQGLTIVREAIGASPGIRLGVAVSRNRGIVAVPLTWDLDAALTFLDAAGSSLTGRGTNLESLVDAAVSAFQPSSPSTRMILLVSDGEETSGSLNTALGRCKRDGIAVTAIAVGSDEGGMLNDEETLSRRDSRAMRTAAGQTGGVYIDGNHEDASRTLAKHLRSLATGAETRGSQTERVSRWFLFVMLAIIIFGASKLCLLRLGSGDHDMKSGSKLTYLIIVSLFLGGCSGDSGISGKLLIMQGNFQNAKGDHTGAISSYMQALEYAQAVPYSEFGLGSVYFALGEEKAALERFAQAEKTLETSDPAANRELHYRIHYNTGVVLFSEGDFSGAAESFREALKIDGGKKDAKRNLELSILSLARDNVSGGGRDDGENENESMAVLFEYMRQKEFNQWKSREWQEEELSGPDY